MFIVLLFASVLHSITCVFLFLSAFCGCRLQHAAAFDFIVAFVPPPPASLLTPSQWWCYRAIHADFGAEVPRQQEDLPCVSAPSSPPRCMRPPPSVPALFAFAHASHPLTIITRTRYHACSVAETPASPLTRPLQLLRSPAPPRQELPQEAVRTQLTGRLHCIAPN